MDIVVLPATAQDKAVVQNMARFCAYDMSRYCGVQEDRFDWSFPEDGLYQAADVSPYWGEPNQYPFIVRIDNELAGFVLINKIGTRADIDWNMGEFFIVAKFQGKGIGRCVAFQIFEKFKGRWEVNQMLSNQPAIDFWNKVISQFTKGQFTASQKTILEPEKHDMIVIEFQSS